MRMVDAGLLDFSSRHSSKWPLVCGQNGDFGVTGYSENRREH